MCLLRCREQESSNARARPVQPIQLLHTLRAHAVIGPSSFIAIAHALCQLPRFRLHHLPAWCPRGHNDRLMSDTTARHAKSKSRPRYSRALVERVMSSLRNRSIIVIVHQPGNPQSRATTPVSPEITASCPPCPSPAASHSTTDAPHPAQSARRIVMTS